MRAVIDTNVLIAALLWRGPPHALLEHVRAGTVSMVSSPALLAEPNQVASGIVRVAKLPPVPSRAATKPRRATRAGIARR